MRVLVTEAEQRSTLAILRTLESAGIETCASSRFWSAPGLHSRYCSKSLVFPGHGPAPEEYADWIGRQCRDLEIDVLLPCHEFSVLALANSEAKWDSGTVVLCSAPAALALCRDKLELGQVARTLGISTPRTFRVTNSAEAIFAASQTGYPLVLKPRTGFGAIGMHLVWDEGGLRRALEECFGESDLVFDRSCYVLQEYVDGPVHDVCTLVNHGQPRAMLTQVRHRMFPAAGGRCVYGETTDIPEIRQKSAVLLKKLGLHGPAHVEFKYDSKRKEYQLLEVNPRFWGSVELSVRAGVNFPELACDLALKGDVDEANSYQTGLKMHWFFPYEVISILQGKSRMEQARKFLEGDFKGEYDFWPGDPLPHLFQALYLSGRLLKHSRRRQSAGR